MSSLGGQWRIIRHYLSLSNLNTEVEKLVQKLKPATPEQWESLIKKFEKAVSVRLSQDVDVKNGQNKLDSKVNASTVEENDAKTQSIKEKGDKEDNISQEGLTVGSDAKEITFEGLWQGLKLKKDLHFGKISEPSWKTNKPIITKNAKGLWFSYRLIIAVRIIWMTGALAVVEPVDRHNGIMIIKEATVYHQINTYHLICIYNISHIREAYIEAVRLYYTFNFEKQNTYEFLAYKQQIEHMIDTIESKLVYLGSKTISFKRTFFPRIKRGLINGLGSIVKAITGNLDQEDANRIEKEINQLQQLNINAKQEQDDTLGIMQTFMNEYKNEITQIQNNIQTYNSNLIVFMKKLNNNTNTLQERVNIINFYIQLEICLQQIYSKISTLENAITFAHIGILHPSIVDPHHLIQELTKIKRENQLNLSFEPILSNIHLIQKSVIVKAYLTNETINFVLEIPLVAKQSYTLLHLYSIPNENNILLIPKSPYLILGITEFAYPIEPCVHITTNEAICKHIEWQHLQDSEDCIAELIQHRKPRNCSYAKANFQDNIVYQIHENSWIIITKHEEIMKTICGDDVQYHRHSGVSLVTITNKCKVLVMGKTLETHNKYLYVQETIPLPRIYNTTNLIDLKIDIKNVKLDKIQDLLQKTKKLANQIEYNPLITTTPSWSSVSILTLLVIGIAIAGYRYWKGKATQQQNVEDVPAQSQDTTQPTSSLRFSLKGGGVM